MAIYNDFDINTAATPKPWGAREEQVIKDIIDTLVGDTIDGVKKTSGHLHGKLYNSSSVAMIDTDSAAFVSVGTTIAIGANPINYDGTAAVGLLFNSSNEALLQNPVHINNSYNAFYSGNSEPVIYSSVDTGAAFPFLEAGHLVLQTRQTATRDIVFVCGATPAVTFRVDDVGNISNCEYDGFSTASYSRFAYFTVNTDTGTDNMSLEVSGSITATNTEVAALYFSNQKSAVSGRATARISAYTGTTGPGYGELHLQTSLNGVLSTSLKLDENGTTYITGTMNAGNQIRINEEGLLLNRSTGSGYVQFTNGSGTSQWAIQRNATGNELNVYNSSGGAGTFHVRASFGGASRLSIDSVSGNVGIGSGATAPGNQLDIITGATLNSAVHIGEVVDEGGYLTSTSDSQFIMSAGAELVGNNWYARSTIANIIIMDSANMRFFCDTGLTDGVSYPPTERMRLDSTGNLGIGTTAPGNQLDIITGATTNSAVHIGEAVDEGGYLTSYIDHQLVVAGGVELVSNAWTARSTVASFINLYDGGIQFFGNTGLTDGNTYSPTLRMVITNGGLVGVSTDTPLARFDIANSAIGLLIGADIGAGSTRTTATRKEARCSTLHYTLTEEPVSVLYADNNSTYSKLVMGGGSSQMNAITAFAICTASAIDTLSGTERFTISNTGYVQITGDQLGIATSKTPASAAATGTTGSICWDADYIYVCTATDTWKRVAIATW